MQSDNKFLSDLAKLGQSAAGTLHGVKSELEGQVKGRLESTLANMDLVRREEYEVVREIATAAREENKNILARLEKIEKEITNIKKKKK
ncbi:accessory factor UbiK family protein [Emcibacteraceae bacterium]|nr:accessory factor UbiK family protein [Emcibacteraceae bacterium]